MGLHVPVDGWIQTHNINLSISFQAHTLAIGPKENGTPESISTPTINATSDFYIPIMHAILRTITACMCPSTLYQII